MVPKMAASWECPSLPMLNFPLKESAQTTFLAMKPVRARAKGSYTHTLSTHTVLASEQRLILGALDMTLLALARDEDHQIADSINYVKCACTCT